MIPIDQDELSENILSTIRESCVREGYHFHQDSSTLIANKLVELILDIHSSLEEYDALFINLFDAIKSKSSFEDFYKQYYEVLLDLASKKGNEDIKDSVLEVADNVLFIKGLKEGNLSIITDMFFNEKSIFESNLNIEERVAGDFFITTMKKVATNSLSYIQQVIDRAVRESTMDLSERFMDSMKLGASPSRTLKSPKPF